MPTGDGSTHICVACLYGISGATTDQGKKDETERIFAGALLRAAQMKDVPYVISTDLNYNPDDSKILSKTIGMELIYDVVKDYFDGEPQPTFRRSGIAADMEGEGTSRIDTVLASPAACNAPAT